LRKRNNQLKFYLDDEEYKSFTNGVESSKMTQSNYVRKLIKDKPIIVLDGLQEVSTALRNLGNNLNQLTRAVNGGKTNSKAEVDQLVKEVEKLQWQLSKLLKVANL